MDALNLPPVAERELRVALRKRGLVRARMRMALVGSGLVLCFLLLSLVDESRTLGRMLHTCLFYFGLYLAIVPTLHSSTGLFTQERDEQALQLLYLTGLGPLEIFMSKLLGGLLVASSELLALAPFMAIPFFMGGVSIEVFLGTVACLPVLLLFVLTVSVLASVVFPDESAAFIGALALAGGICVAVPLPWFLGRMVTGGPPFSSDWLCLSPGYGPFLIGTHFAGASPSVFWLSEAVTLGWSAVCVIAAGVLLRRNARAIADSRPRFDWRQRWQEWIYGTPEWRARLRRKVMPKNPYQWLVERDRRPILLAWVTVAGICVLWLVCWWAWPRVWPSTVTLYAAAALIILTGEPLRSHAAARRIGQDRRDGQLELLLTTPLPTEEIVEGQMAAMRSQFRPLRRALVGLCVLMAIGGLSTRDWTTLALVNYMLIWVFFLVWCLWPLDNKVSSAMWVALNTGRPMMAVSRLRTNVWGWIWLAYNLRTLYRLVAGVTVNFPTGTSVETVIICFGLMVVLLIVAAVQSDYSDLRFQLAREMRSIAQEPVPPANDPRFKNWNMKERLPGSAHDRMTEFASASEAKAEEAKRKAERLKES